MGVVAREKSGILIESCEMCGIMAMKYVTTVEPL